MGEPRAVDDVALLGDALDVLERVGCQFWACNGPDHPEQPMRTCFVCREIRTLRARLGRPRVPEEADRDR